LNQRNRFPGHGPGKNRHSYQFCYPCLCLQVLPMSLPRALARAGYQSRNAAYDGSVIKVLQKEAGHGSHWGVLRNPVKRKARP
jgi:hypothetical protein